MGGRSRTRLAKSLGTGICLGLASVSAAAPASANAATTGPAFVIQSHRGAGNLSTDNTLVAFELGWKIGTVPEADVRTTSDGVIVGFHDENFARLVKDCPAELRERGVEDLTWSEIQKLDVGAYKGPEYAGQRVPAIRDVFARMKDHPERWLYLDVKKVPLERLAALVREYSVESQVILASTIYEHHLEWKKLLPQSQTLLWMGAPEKKLTERLKDLRKRNYEAITQVQIHVKVSDSSTTDPFTPSSKFLKSVGMELKQAGVLYMALPWQRHEPETYHRLLDLGVESFASDEPMVTLDAVRTWKGLHK